MPDARAAVAAGGTPLGRGTKRVPWDARSDAVVKETRRRGKLARLLVASRARRAFDAARVLQRAGVFTPEPLACIEEGDRAFFVARFVDGRALDVRREGEEAAALLARVHAALVVHGDWKPANLLVAREGIFVLDLDAARIVSRIPPRRSRARDLGALVAYAERLSVSEKKRRAIVDAYLAAASFAEEGDAFARAVFARSALKLARWARA